MARSSTTRAMARRNRFAALATDDEVVDAFDAVEIEALGYLLAPALAPAGLDGLLADNLLADNLPADNLPAANFAPATEDALGGDAIFIGDDLNHVLDNDDPSNPWKLVTSRSGRKRENKTNKDTEPNVKEKAINKDAQPTEYGQLAVEVPWVAKGGSLRRIRKNAQDRKGGFAQAEERPGFYVYGTFRSDSLEF